MKTFYLPDLGEGLNDAEILKWHVKIGDKVKLNQPLVCIETQAAVMDVPSPQAGIIKFLYRLPGDVIDAGAPLVEFVHEIKRTQTSLESIIGNLQPSPQGLIHEIILSTPQNHAPAIKALPAVRAMASHLSIDLSAVVPTGPKGEVTLEDVKNFSQQLDDEDQVDVLRGVRRAMAVTMMQSHDEVVQATLFDDADITHVPSNTNLTALILSAMVAAVKAAPNLNAWFEGKCLERRIFKEINVGLMVDTSEGLFIPVLKNLENKTQAELENMMRLFQSSLASQKIAPSDLHGATIALSNFGKVAGRYATPIIVPPMVSILGIGKMGEEVKVVDGQIAIRKIVPLSLSFDHRAVTDGEATRFLASLINHLENPNI